MATTAPGDIKAMLPPTPPQHRESFDAIIGDLDRVVARRASRRGSIRASSAISRRTRSSPACLATYVSTGLGVHRSGVAVESRAHRSRRGRRGLDAPDARPVGRLERRDQRHGVDQHAGGAACARASARPITALAAAACRPNRSRSSSTPRRTATARWRRPRCWPASAANQRAHRAARRLRMRCVPNRSKQLMQDDVQNGRQPCAVVATTGTTTSTALDPIARDRARRRGRTVCGSTSMRRWPARR